MNGLETAAIPAYACVGSVFIDDIVFPDGRTCMEVLGGGGTHAAAAVRLWGERAGLVACIGQGIPQSALARLQRDFDLDGIRWLDLPQARAWQIFEWDTRRIEVFRVDVMQPFVDDPQPEHLTSRYHAVPALHVLRDGPNFLRWRGLFPQATLLWEPNQPYMVSANRDEFRALLRHADIVSPNLLEAQQIYGSLTPEVLLQSMLDDGAPVVVLRMGEVGSMVARQGEAPLSIPAVPVAQVVDQTGAGNTYCGAFLVGWMRSGGDLLTAACYGAVAASFALEVIGVCDVPPDDPRRDARYRALLEQLSSV